MDIRIVNVLPVDTEQPSAVDGACSYSLQSERLSLEQTGILGDSRLLLWCLYMCMHINFLFYYIVVPIRYQYMKLILAFRFDSLINIVL